MRTCGKRIEFDAAHRVMRHESKCAHLHGHRYGVNVECAADNLDSLGRVIDFSVIKSVVGDWIDRHLDHGMIANAEDVDLIELCEKYGWKLYVMDEGNPTAENIAKEIYFYANEFLSSFRIKVVSVRVYETPSCWADYP